jgi:hypothetical protein
VPWANVPVGYVRGDGGVLVPSADADAVREAFRMRLDGETVAAVRTYLAERGIHRAYSKVTLMLSNRIYLGEIRFGTLVNQHAHEPLVDVETFRRIQNVRIPSGRRAKSERLLARLGILRCASCGSRMIVGTQRQHGRSYPFYRCGRVREDCAERPAISAVLVERLVTDAVQHALAGVVGRASAGQDAIEAEGVLERAQADLDAAIRAFAGVQDEPVALERLVELRQARDEAAGHAERLRGLRSAIEVTALHDWNSLSLPARRGLIQAVVARVVVSRGRGAGRVRVEMRE